MTVNFSAFGAWLKSKNWTAHSIAIAGVAVSSAIMTDQQIRDIVIGVFQAHPKIGTGIITAAGIILKYSHSSSDAGTVATADKIMTSPNPPTSAAIDAATPKPATPKENQRP